MDRRNFLALLLPLAAVPRETFAAEHAELTAADLAYFTSVFESIARADTFTLYEGLPDPSKEKDLFTKERIAKKTIVMRKYAFYEQPLVVEAKDVESLRLLTKDPKTYGGYGGAKMCGLFHPDFALVWKDGKEVHELLVCFTCSDMWFFASKTSKILDIRKEHAATLIATLGKYRNQRPKTPDSRF